MKEKQTVNIHGREYETVASRLKRWREKFPPPENAYCLETRIVEMTEERVVVQAYIKTPDGIIIGSGLAEERRDTSQINRTSALENCETSAIGRALASIGYLSGEYASADEVANAIRQQQTQPQKSISYSDAQFGLVAKLLAEILPDLLEMEVESHDIHRLAKKLLKGADKQAASKKIDDLKQIKDNLAAMLAGKETNSEADNKTIKLETWARKELGLLEK